MPLTVEEKKERNRKASKKYRESEKGWTKEQKKDYNRQYHLTHKEFLNNSKKKYRKKDEGIKANIKGNWKAGGLNMKHFEIIYLLYKSTTECDICKCELGDGKPMKSNTKCMDHCHYTGNFRNILCNSCNVKLPKQIISK